MNNSYTCIERVQLSFLASNLKNAAGAFKGTSDPYAVVTLIANNNEVGAKPQILGKTEVIKNCLSPHWVKTFEVDYDFSKETKINVSILDEIRKEKNDKPMGTAIFEVGTILGARENMIAKKLKPSGTIYCKVQKVPMNAPSNTAHFQLAGIKLKKVSKCRVSIIYLMCVCVTRLLSHGI